MSEHIRLQPMNLIPFPNNKIGLQNEIRFNMAYCRANRLLDTSKFLGELLITLKTEDINDMGHSHMTP